MRNFWPIAIIGFVMLALSTPGRGVCVPGGGGCEPTVEETRAKVEQLLNSALLSTYSIVSLEKLEGHDGDMFGRKTYEIRFLATLNYSGDKLRCRRALCPELQNYSVQINEATKKATVSGWLFFEQTGQDWR
jgi:hypothetical protein